MQIIPDGAMVTVNGDAGSVTVVQEDETIEGSAKLIDVA
jgi:hypothetical protein